MFLKGKEHAALDDEVLATENLIRAALRDELDVVKSQKYFGKTYLISEQIFEWAKEPKEIVIYPGAEHGLKECKDELHDLLRTWIPERFEASQ